LARKFYELNVPPPPHSDKNPGNPIFFFMSGSEAA